MRNITRISAWSYNKLPVRWEVKGMKVLLYGFMLSVALLYTISRDVIADVHISGSISSDTTWTLADSPYIVTDDVVVTEGVMLTIEPGVVVKFEQSAILWVEGDLVADGTSEAQIVFTSLKDDSYGGETNGDGAATTPVKNDWGNIVIFDTSKHSILDYVVVKYAGQTWSFPLWQRVPAIQVFTSNLVVSNSMITESGYDAIAVTGSSPTIIDNVIVDNDRDGIRLSNASPQIMGNTIIGAGQYISGHGIYATNSSNPIIEDNVIGDNSGWAIRLDPSSSGAAVSGNSLFGLWAGIYIDAGDLNKSVTWDSDSTYVIGYGGAVKGLTIKEGSRLTIEPGVVVKFGQSAILWVEGDLVADGTSEAQIVFTSLKDDSYGGDTNGDGAATTPVKNDWGNICFWRTCNGSILDYVVVQYGGQTWSFPSWSSLPAVNVVTSNLLISNSIITENGDDGISIWYASPRIADNTITNNDNGIYLYNASPTITGNTITANNRCGIYLKFSSGSTIYLNNFIDNNSNVRSEDSSSIWNSPKEIDYRYNVNVYTNHLGNYWDDYTGTDADGDGIGDTPYGLDGGNDNYPLMMSFENYEIGGEPPESWSFAIISDLHIGKGQGSWYDFFSDYDGWGWNDNSGGEYHFAIGNLEDTIWAINQSIDDYNIEFVVVCGDISDSGELSELNKAKEILDHPEYGLKVPWIPLIGNHDVWPYTYLSEAEASHPITPLGDGPDKYFDDIFSSQYIELFTHLQNFERGGLPVLNKQVDPARFSYFQNFTFDHKGYHFIGLDFNHRGEAIWQRGTKPEGELQDYKDDVTGRCGSWRWFTNHIKDYNDTHPEGANDIILLAHHPFRQWNAKKWGIETPVDMGFSEEELKKMSEFLRQYKDRIRVQFAGHSHPKEDKEATVTIKYYDWFDDIMQIAETGATVEGPIATLVQVNSDGTIDCSKMIPEGCFYIKAICPVDLEVIDPDGLIISKQINEISGARYEEDDTNGDGSLEDIVYILQRKKGDYQINVIPEPDATSTDTYTLGLAMLEDSYGYVPIVLAEDVPIEEVPTEPYTFEVKEREPTQLTYTGDLQCQYGLVDLSATLTDEAGNPLSNKKVVYEIDIQSTSVVTDSNGIATASLMLNQALPGKYYYVDASFSGDEDYLPSADSKPFKILESAKWFKVDAVSELNSIETSTDKVQKDIRQAIAHIEQSLDESLWLGPSRLDSNHGHKVFSKEKHAVQDLLRIVEERGAHADPNIADWAWTVIDKIIDADELITNLAIVDAKDALTANSRFQKQIEQEIARAENEMAKAYEELNDGKLHKAIDYFKKAWKHTQQAIKFANLGAEL